MERHYLSMTEKYLRLCFACLMKEEHKVTLPIASATAKEEDQATCADDTGENPMQLELSRFTMPRLTSINRSYASPMDNNNWTEFFSHGLDLTDIHASTRLQLQQAVPWSQLLGKEDSNLEVYTDGFYFAKSGIGAWPPRACERCGRQPCKRALRTCFWMARLAMVSSWL